MTDDSTIQPDPYVPVPSQPAADQSTLYQPSPYQSTPGQSRPGRGLGIAGFVVSLFWGLDLIALILSIVAMVQSRRAGQKNGFALAGIIISIVGIVTLSIVLVFAIPTLVAVGQECAKLGNGVHHVGNSIYTCTPTSFNESTFG